MKNKKGKRFTRRNFLRTTATAAAAFTIIPRHVLGGKGFTSPGDMVNVAGVGVGGRGASDIRGICTPEVIIPRNQSQGAGASQNLQAQARAQTPASLQHQGHQLILQTFMHCVTSIHREQQILLRVIPGRRSTQIGAKCLIKKNQILMLL